MDTPFLDSLIAKAKKPKDSYIDVGELEGFGENQTIKDPNQVFDTYGVGPAFAPNVKPGTEVVGQRPKPCGCVVNDDAEDGGVKSLCRRHEKQARSLPDHVLQYEITRRGFGGYTDDW